MLVMQTLGELIREARKRKRLTSLDLALQIGVTQATISRLENDEYAQAPKPEITHALSDALGIPERELLEAAGYRISAAESAPSIDKDDPLYNVVFWELRKLTPEDLDAVRAIVRRLARESE